MKKPIMKNKKRYTLTISMKLYDEFQKVCYDNLRTVSGTVNQLIEEYLKQQTNTTNTNRG